MDQIIFAWYGWLSSLTQGMTVAVQGWADRSELPVLSAIVIGLLGATSPCQLTTNLSALAYASAHPGGWRPITLVLAYVGGKVCLHACRRPRHPGGAPAPIRLDPGRDPGAQGARAFDA